MKTKVQQFTEGIGGVKMWGYSPAVDISALALDSSASKRESNTSDAEATALEALLVFPGDITSALLTMSRLGRWPRRDKTHLYVMEQHPEVLARHLLLLSIFIDPDLGPRECTEMFLEVYGNSHIRKQTSAFVQSKVQELVRFLTETRSGEAEQRLAALVDVSLLKSKQRDAIEKVLLSWSEAVETDMSGWREKRMRAYFDDRYDYRKNLIDWDYSMSVKDWASVIHKQLYHQWREEGIAFEIRESKYPEPNRTLASYAEGKEKGFSKLKRGFWGDVVQSPYWSLGVAAEEESLFKVRSLQHTKTCQHVCEFNMYAMLTELQTGERYKLGTEHEETYGRSFWGGLGSSGASLETLAEDEDEEDVTKDRLDSLSKGRAKGAAGLLGLEGFKIFLLQGEGVQGMQDKKRFQGLFDLCTLSFQATHCLKQEQGLSGLLKGKAKVVCEGADLLLNLDKEDKKAFAEKIEWMGRGIGCRANGSARDGFKIHTGVLYPLYHLEYNRFEAPGIIVAYTAEEEKQAKSTEKEAGTIEDVLGDKQVSNGEAVQPSTDDDAEGQQQGMVTLTGKTRENAEVEVKKDPPGSCGYCAVTGKPAKYRDPKTGQPYADLAAFKQLRGLVDEPVRSEEAAVALEDKGDQRAEEGQGGEGGAGQEVQKEEEVEPLFAQKKRGGWRLGGSAVA